MGIPEAVRVLAICPAEADCIALGNIFSHSKWTLDCVKAPDDGVRFLQEHPVPVVICACRLPGSDWKAIVAEAARQPVPPRVIVASPGAGDELWSEVLELGGYDVLAQPFHAPEVVRVVSLAWRQWKHELEKTRKSQGSAGSDEDHERRAAGSRTD
jgi:DNA-binding response OmpR family regulator